MKPKVSNPDPNYLRSLFEYDPKTGHVVWKVDRPFQKIKGKRAGCVGATGYRQIRFDGATHKESRLIWALMTGKWPANLVDHINEVKDDNRWENLREATISQNRQNISVKKQSSSGKKCVFQACRKYRARIKNDVRTIHLGTFTSADLASAAYEAAARQIHGEFARA